MKTLKLFLISLSMMLTGYVQGQVSINVNIGTPPAWGPAGYSDVRYYYLPDLEIYYDVQRTNYIYFSDNRWVRMSYLPSRYKNYDLYRGYKVVLQDYRGNYPYYNFKQHKIKYAKGYKGNPQKTIGVRKNNQDKQHINIQKSKGNGNGQGNMNKNMKNQGTGKNKK